MNKLMRIALFLLMSIVLSGCLTDNTRPDPNGPEALKFKMEFEEGRLAEYSLTNDRKRYDNIRFASEKYEDLIKSGSRYGEYGLAKLLQNWYPEHEEDTVKYLITCAKRSSYTSDMFPDSAMDSAFSVAAMAQLSDIATAKHDRQDIADSLRRMMSKVVTEEVRAWADTMKTNTVSAKIYEDVISAVESDYQSSGYVKVLSWDEISKILVNGDAVDGSPAGGGGMCRSKPSYSVVRFVKSLDAASQCQYDFEIQLTGNDTFDAAAKARSAMRCQLVKEFRTAHPSLSVDDIGLSYPFWNHSGSTIKGTVVAKFMKVSVMRLEYDDATGFGKITVRLGDSDVVAAKKLAIDNIEELATRKNIVNVVGKRPPKGARYKTTNEQTTKDGLLEIEFKCE